MGYNHEYPEFSNIRSHLARAEARRHMDIGYALADALIDAGEFLRRAVSGVLSSARAVTARFGRR